MEIHQGGGGIDQGGIFRTPLNHYKKGSVFYNYVFYSIRYVPSQLSLFSALFFISVRAMIMSSIK